MGMFTTIIDAEGREHQIKTGNDFCETYRIGDEVPFRIQETPGDVDFPDGIYQSSIVTRWEAGQPQTFPKGTVIIKDHKVLTAHSDFLGPETEDIDPTWWTEEAWIAKRQVDERRRIESEAQFDAFLAEGGLTREQFEELPAAKQLSMHLAYGIRGQMTRPSFARQVLNIEEK